MNYINTNNLSKLGIGLFYSLLLVSCASVKDQYEFAARSGHINTLKVFLKNNPNSFYTDKTRSMITNIALRKARAQNTEEAYQKIINNNPGNMQLYRLASGKIESLGYAKARSINTIAAYKAFLLRFPFGKTKAAAQSRIESIMFQAILKGKNEQSVKDYLKTAKRNKDDIKQAKKLLEKLAYEKALADNTINAYQFFISQYENSIFAIKATERLLNLRLPSTMYLSDKGHVSIQQGKITSISNDTLVASYGETAKQQYILSKNTLVCSKTDKEIAPTNLESNQQISIATIPSTNQNTVVAIYIGNTTVNANFDDKQPSLTDFPNCFPPLSKR